MTLLLLACTPEGDTVGHVDTGVESIPDDTSDAGLPADTGDSGEATGEECGEIAPDDAGWFALFDPGVLHAYSLELAVADHDELAASPQDYVPANLTVDGVVMANVGLRMRGSGESMRWDAKPSFRIDLRRYGNCDPLASIDEIVLDAGEDDPAMARQVLGAQVFAALGIAAPAAAFATIQVDGEAFGLYTQVEAVDAHFVAHHGFEPGGILWEGKDGADFSAVGLGEWDDVGGGGDPATLAAVATAIATAGDDFYATVDTHLDMPQFLATWAGLAAVGHHQSFPYEPGDGYLYAAPSDPRLVLIPWEVDEGWSSTFVWNGVETQLGLRCVYDATCHTALRGSLSAAIDGITVANVPSLASSAFTMSEAAALADERKGWSNSEVLAAREALATSMTGWAAWLGAALQ